VKEELLRHAKSIVLYEDDDAPVMTVDNVIVAQQRFRQLLASCSQLSVLHSDFLPKLLFQCFPHMNLQEVRLSKYAASNDALDMLCNFHPQLHSLALFFSNGGYGKLTSERAAQSILRLTMLQKLSLKHCDTAFVKFILRFVSLCELSLSHSSVHDKDVLAWSSSLLNLNKLRLYNTDGFTNNAFSNISLLVNLTEFDVSSSAIGDATMLSLCGCKDLQVLIVRTATITDVGLMHISDMSSLRKIDLSFCRQITSTGIAHHLVNLARLTVLWLDGCAVDDDCVKTLSSMKTLKDLSLQECELLTNLCLSHLCLIQPQLERLAISLGYGIKYDQVEIDNLILHVRNLDLDDE